MHICAVDFACTNCRKFKVFVMGHGGCVSAFLKNRGEQPFSFHGYVKERGSRVKVINKV